MSKSIDNGGPVFPSPDVFHPNGQIQYGEIGLTLRDYFASQALPVIISKLCFEGLYREECSGESINYANAAYKLADAMIKARQA